MIQHAQGRALSAVNTELVMLYWNAGESVSQKVQGGTWGEDVVGQLADFIQKKQPNLKGFNKRGLYRMRQFYDTYQGIEKVSPLLTQIAWSSHLMILSRCKGKDTEVVEFSLRRNISPALVADYELKLIDKEILKKKLNELFEAFNK
jgi:hypothetical protein